GLRLLAVHPPAPALQHLLGLPRRNRKDPPPIAGHGRDPAAVTRPRSAVAEAASARAGDGSGQADDQLEHIPRSARRRHRGDPRPRRLRRDARTEQPEPAAIAPRRHALAAHLAGGGKHLIAEVRIDGLSRVLYPHDGLRATALDTDADRCARGTVLD